MKNEKRAATPTAATPEIHSKVTEFRPTMQPTAPILAQKVRLFNGIRDTEGRGGTHSILHLISDFCSRDDVRSRCRTARADRAKKSSLYGSTYAHRGTREAGVKIDPTTLVTMEFDDLRDPDNFESKAMASGAVFCKPSLSKGYHIAYMYDPEELEYSRALKAAIKYAQENLGEAVDLNATNDVRVFYISDKPATINEQGVVFDLAMVEWLEAIHGGQETPTPPRTRDPEPPRPKRGRPRNNEAKMQGFLVECEFYHDMTPDDGSWNSCLRKWCEKVAGAGIDRDEATEWARDVFAPRASCEREFISMFTRAYKEVENKEKNKAQKAIENLKEGDYVAIKGIDHLITPNGVEVRNTRYAREMCPDYKNRPKFEAITNEPDNRSYQRVIDGAYNLAPRAPRHEVLTAHCDTIIKLIKHVGASWYVGEDDGNGWRRLMLWLQLLYNNPKQDLPILCLTSDAQCTGKSTTINLTHLMLGSAAVESDIVTLTGKFTAGFAAAQLMTIDEEATDSAEQSKYLKKYSTAKLIRYEAKGTNDFQMPCHLKFLTANNHSSRAAYLEEADTRHVILEVGTIQEPDPRLLEKMQEEIGYFCEVFLRDLPHFLPMRGRLWFTPQDLCTKATLQAKKSSRSTMQEAIENMLDDIKSHHPTIAEIRFTISTIKWYVEHTGYEWRQDAARVYLRKVCTEKPSREQMKPDFGSDGDNVIWALQKGSPRRLWVYETDDL